MKDSRDVIFEPTKMPLVSFKRCFQVDFQTALGLFVAFLIYEKITKMLGPLEFQNAQLTARSLYTWRVPEAFNYPSNNQKRL